MHRQPRGRTVHVIWLMSINARPRRRPRTPIRTWVLWPGCSTSCASRWTVRARPCARFVRDADAARESDLEELDTSAPAHRPPATAPGLRRAGNGGPGPSGAGAARHGKRRCSALCSAPSLHRRGCRHVERASFALIEYLETVLAGKTVSAVALFPQYRDAQALAGATTRCTPPTCGLPSARARARVGAPARAAALRPRGPGSLLDAAWCCAWSRSDDRSGRRPDCATCAWALPWARPNRMSPRAASGRWRPASSTRSFAGLLIVADLYVKRMASRVLMQYAAMAKGDRTPPARRLLQDLLFFCSQAKARPAETGWRRPAGGAPGLGLGRPKPGGLPAATLWPLRPGGAGAGAQAHQPRPGIPGRPWRAATATAPRPVVDQFALVAIRCVKLHPASHGLAQALTAWPKPWPASGEPSHRPNWPWKWPPPCSTCRQPLKSWTWATTNWPDGSPRTGPGRAPGCGIPAGAPAEPLEPWMEELYRQGQRPPDHGQRWWASCVPRWARPRKGLDQFSAIPPRTPCWHPSRASGADARRAVGAGAGPGHRWPCSSHARHGGAAGAG